MSSKSKSNFDSIQILNGIKSDIFYLTRKMYITKEFVISS